MLLVGGKFRASVKLYQQLANTTVVRSCMQLAMTAQEKIAEKPSETRYHWDIVWRNVFLLLTVHLLGFYGIFAKYYYIPMWQSVVFNIFQLFFNGLGVTAGRHRLWSHRSYKAHRGVHIFLAAMAASVYEQSIYVWCRDHRLHHKHSDTDADPYNSRRGFFFSHMGWFFVRKHAQVREKGATLDLSDLRANPVVMFEHRWNKTLALIFTALLPSVIPVLCWGERARIAIGYCCFWRILLVLHITWSVNSFAHLYGWRPYDTRIEPVENVLVAFAAAGEGFHNYHHAFPWDYKAAELGGDVRNLTTTFIDILAYCGLVYDRRAASKDMVKQRIARTGDPSALGTSLGTLRNSLMYIIALALIA